MKKLNDLIAVMFKIDQVGTDNLKNREHWLRTNLRGIAKGSRILDAGAGELKYKKFCKHLSYVSQDFAQYDGQGNQEGLQAGNWDNSRLDIVSDITEIPEKAASFDAIMCIEVLEHVPYPVAAIKEFNRLLKPNGKLLITVPYASLVHMAPYHFQSGFSSYWFEKWLKEYNFSIDQISKNGNYFEYLAQEIHRIESVENIYGQTNVAKNFFFILSRIIMLNSLWKMSQRNKNSEDILCYGIQVVATKLNEDQS